MALINEEERPEKEESVPISDEWSDGSWQFSSEDDASLSLSTQFSQLRPLLPHSNHHFQDPSPHLSEQHSKPQRLFDLFFTDFGLSHICSFLSLREIHESLHCLSVSLSRRMRQFGWIRSVAFGNDLSYVFVGKSCFGLLTEKLSLRNLVSKPLWNVHTLKVQIQSNHARRMNGDGESTLSDDWRTLLEKWRPSCSLMYARFEINSRVPVHVDRALSLVSMICQCAPRLQQFYLHCRSEIDSDLFRSLPELNALELSCNLRAEQSIPAVLRTVQCRRLIVDCSVTPITLDDLSLIHSRFQSVSLISPHSISCDRIPLLQSLDPAHPLQIRSLNLTSSHLIRDFDRVQQGSLLWPCVIPSGLRVLTLDGRRGYGNSFKGFWLELSEQVLCSVQILHLRFLRYSDTLRFLTQKKDQLRSLTQLQCLFCLPNSQIDKAQIRRCFDSNKVDVVVKGSS